MLIILLAALTAVFAAILWLLSVLLQGWLYNELATKLPLRALVGGLVLSLFHTGWCAIYRADPGRFDTLYSFKTEATDGDYDEFLSVRRVGKTEQKPVKFIRRGQTNEFESADTRRPWNRSDSDGMVVAILIQEKDRKEPTRFEANLDASGNFRPREDSRYEADGGRRYMDLNSLGKVYRKRSWAIMGNLFVNFLHLVVWVVVLWPILRFTLNHSIGFGLLFWVITMLIQPALFGLVTRP